MTAPATDRAPWAIPEQALTEWQALAVALEDAGTVPCRSSDPEAWWPDKKSVDGPVAQLAIAGCWTCPALEPCRAYALAADEREGIWGAMLPADRRHVTSRAA